MFDKYFTLQEAEELLPTVEQGVEAIRSSKQALDACEAEFSALAKKIVEQGGLIVDLDQWSPKRVLREAVAGKIVEEVEKLEALGVLIKDFDMGLVDFPSRLGEEEVLLCWKSGEPRIQHWHRTTEGYANRKPLAAGSPPPSPQDKKSVQ